MNSKKLKNISFIYFGLSLLLFGGNFLIFDRFTFIFGLITLILGIYFFSQKNDFVQFEIREDRIFYFPLKNRNPKFRFQELFNYLMKNYSVLKLSEIKSIEKIDSVITGMSIIIILKNNKKVDVLLNTNRNQFNDIYYKLKELI